MRSGGLVYGQNMFEREVRDVSISCAVSQLKIILLPNQFGIACLVSPLPS